MVRLKKNSTPAPPWASPHASWPHGMPGRPLRRSAPSPQRPSAPQPQRPSPHPAWPENRPPLTAAGPPPQPAYPAGPNSLPASATRATERRSLPPRLPMRLLKWLPERRCRCRHPSTAAGGAASGPPAGRWAWATVEAKPAAGPAVIRSEGKGSARKIQKLRCFRPVPRRPWSAGGQPVPPLFPGSLRKLPPGETLNSTALTLFYLLN